MLRALERESGAKLLTMTGGIDIGRASNPAMLAIRSALTEAGFGSVWLAGREARDYAPQFNFPDDWAVLWQSGAGILNAGRCVRALAAQAIAYGATLVEGARVERLEPGARTTRVTYQQRDSGSTVEVDARSVVIAAGPWAGQMFGALRVETELRVTHQQVFYTSLVEMNRSGGLAAARSTSPTPKWLLRFPVCDGRLHQGCHRTRYARRRPLTNSLSSGRCGARHLSETVGACSAGTPEPSRS